MKAPDIFQVEDDENFTFFMENAVSEMDESLVLKIAPNGLEAMQFLRELQYNSVKPGMILLDINLPGISGFDILKAVREIEFFHSVPVVIFSTSDNPRDAEKMMKFGANGYQTKPMGYLGLLSCLDSMRKDYLRIN